MCTHNYNYTTVAYTERSKQYLLLACVRVQEVKMPKHLRQPVWSSSQSVTFVYITQDAPECEVCLLHMHRYCAGLSRSHYQELLSKSTPFVCTVCTQRSQKALIQQLQDEVLALRCELDKLRAAASNSAANTCNYSTSSLAVGSLYHLESHINCIDCETVKPVNFFGEQAIKLT